MNRKVLFILFFTLVLMINSCGHTQFSQPETVNSAPDGSNTQERQLKRFTTYQTSLTQEDIMRSFVNEVRIYLQWYSYGYYLISFEVFQENDKQNYAWGTSTFENKYQWGTVYTIRLWISNADLYVKFCNTSFTSNGQHARGIATTGSGIRKHIVDTATYVFNESEMMLKMYNRNYSDESKTVFLTEILRILF